MEIECNYPRPEAEASAITCRKGKQLSTGNEGGKAAAKINQYEMNWGNLN